MIEEWRHKNKRNDLPSGYIQHKTINHFYPSCGTIVIYWTSIAVAFAIWEFVYFSVVISVGKSDDAFPLGQDKIGLMILVACALSYLSHELVHYFVAKSFGAKPRWGGRRNENLSYYLKKWLPKITASVWSNFVYSKAQYLCVTLLPLFLLNILYIFLITVLPASVLIGCFVIAGIFNGIISILDIFLAILVAFSPAEAYFKDELNGLIVYIPSN